MQNKRNTPGLSPFLSSTQPSFSPSGSSVSSRSYPPPSYTTPSSSSSFSSAANTTGRHSSIETNGEGEDGGEIKAEEEEEEDEETSQEESSEEESSEEEAQEKIKIKKEKKEKVLHPEEKEGGGGEKVGGGMEQTHTRAPLQPPSSIIVRTGMEGNLKAEKNAAIIKKPENEEKKLLKIKKKEKKNKKTERIYVSVVSRLSRMSNLLEKDFEPKDENKFSKDLAKQLAKYEKDLQKLSKHLKDPKVKTFSQATIPFGLLKALDNYEEPMCWIQRCLFKEQKKANDKLKGALYAIGSLKSTVEGRLLYGEAKTVLPPVFAECPALNIPLSIPQPLKEAHTNLEAPEKRNTNKLPAA